MIVTGHSQWYGAFREGKFDGRGHSLTIDNGWNDVAEVSLKWLDSKGF
jgi:hypothetical protein